jgi:hypothetical protein
MDIFVAATAWEATVSICTVMFAPMAVWMAMLGVYHLYEYITNR